VIDFKHGAQNKRASKEKEEKSIQKRSVSCSVKLFLALLSFADLRPRARANDRPRGVLRDHSN